MKINIAGAGSGKTTKIADHIIECYESIDSGKIVYCIAYTNNAAACIEEKIKNHYGEVPRRIKISTIHSFLYQELIRPYYYLLYGRQFEQISDRDLNKIKKKYYKAAIKKLEDNNILHIDAFAERAKWVFVKKSKDTKLIRKRRDLVRKNFASYCGAIFLDEGQDINNDVLKLLVAFHEAGIEVNVMGDPKQDLRGYGNLKRLAEKYPEAVTYITECYRCPQKHLNLSNTIVDISEQQESFSDEEGELCIVFEKDVDRDFYGENTSFDLSYISEKNSRFDTHKDVAIGVDTGVVQELEEILCNHDPEMNKKTIKRAAYYYSDIMCENVRRGKGNNISQIINYFVEVFGRQLEKFEYAKLAQALKAIDLNSETNKIGVASIEAIKGMGKENCLFILTTDLAAYLFMDKTEANKVKNKLYVALTRSKKKLTILITVEVEKKYGRNFIEEYMSKFC